MEKIHVIFPGIEREHTARPRPMRDYREILRIDKARGEIAEEEFGALAKRLHAQVFYPLDRHGEVWGQEVHREGPNRTPVWRSQRHTGGRHQFCCEMEVPSADQAAHYARYGMRVILLRPQRHEGTRLLPSIDSNSGASLQ